MSFPGRVATTSLNIHNVTDHNILFEVTVFTREKPQYSVQLRAGDWGTLQLPRIQFCTVAVFAKLTLVDLGVLYAFDFGVEPSDEFHNVAIHEGCVWFDGSRRGAVCTLEEYKNYERELEMYMISTLTQPSPGPPTPSFVAPPRTFAAAMSPPTAPAVKYVPPPSSAMASAAAAASSSAESQICKSDSVASSQAPAVKKQEEEGGRGWFGELVGHALVAVAGALIGSYLSDSDDVQLARRPHYRGPPCHRTECGNPPMKDSQYCSKHRCKEVLGDGWRCQRSVAESRGETTRCEKHAK